MKNIAVKMIVVAMNESIYRNVSVVENEIENKLILNDFNVVEIIENFLVGMIVEVVDI